ncbi:hypothetical protein WA026_012552 [Henosepilachna vigintioctopunctata]|uniref:Uncharacterized protein n=1 Tax=Henosepilachna vigintioctopunctata TaxID=420089 RepID=A0AAW1U5E4_9CUCU
MNHKERTRSNTDSNGGNDRNMKKTEDVGMHATEIHNSKHRRRTECEVLNLRKRGKDPSDPSSYRPICLLSCVGKLYERLLVNRINRELEK